MVILDDQASVPLYVQIYEQLKDIMINTGRIPPGCRLPSSRQFAQSLNVSRNTVEAAYQQLYAEGYIESKPRQGFFASEFDKNMLTSLQGQVVPKFGKLECGGKESSDYRYDFRARRIDVNNFPFPLWNKLISKCIKENSKGFASYGHPQGELSLRQKIAAYLATYRGISCSPGQIILCAGTQHALTILCQLFSNEVNAIAMEEPGNYGARVVFQNHGMRIVPVPVEQDGVSTKSLHFSRAQAIYVTPSRQFPLGVIMSVAKRTKLLEWAKINDAVIIEDDFNSYYRYNTRPVPALYGMSGLGKVVYLGSFAQAVLPSVRISYMVLPTMLLDKFQQMFRFYDSPVSVLFQKSLELFMESGYFERHLRRMNQVYKKKHDLMIKAIREYMGDKVEISSSKAGLHVLLKINDKINEQELLEKAERAGVKISSISLHWFEPKPDEKTIILLSFGGVGQEDIIPGIKLLSNAWFSGEA